MSQVDTVPKSAASNANIVELSDDEDSSSRNATCSSKPKAGTGESSVLGDVVDLESDTRDSGHSSEVFHLADHAEHNSNSSVIVEREDQLIGVDDAIEQDAQYIMSIGADWQHEDVVALLLAHADHPSRVNIVIETLLERDSTTSARLPEEQASSSRPLHSTAKQLKISNAALEEAIWGKDGDLTAMDARLEKLGNFIPQSAINALTNQQVYAPIGIASSSMNQSRIFPIPSNSNPSTSASSHRLSPWNQSNTAGSSSAPSDMPGTSGFFGNPGTSSSFAQAAACIDQHRSLLAAADCFHADVIRLTDMFPDCDPSFLRSRLEDSFEATDRVERVIEALLKAGDYPKLPDRKKKEYVASQKRERLSQIIDFSDYLRAYPNPEAHFSNQQARVAESYKQHARAYLLAVFSSVRSPANEVDSALAECNHHFLPAFRLLKSKHPDLFEEPSKPKSQPFLFAVDVPASARNKGSYKLRAQASSATPKQSKGLPKWHERVKPDAMPETIDEQFYDELLYARYEEDVKAELRNCQAARQCRLEELKQPNSTNWLLTCAICYDDQVFPEDTFTCESKPNEHVFCRECMRKYVDCEMGMGRYAFRCLTGECSFEFTVRHLSVLLPKRLLEKVLDKRLEADLASTNNTAIVSCPFCSYTFHMEDANYSEIACANPACMRRSCRFCRENSHIPFSCDEVKRNMVEKEYMEKKLSEAVIRICFRCKKPYVKSDGCNMITCTCGAMQCYVCGAKDIDYSHFGRGKCQQHDMKVDSKRLDEANRKVTDDLRNKTIVELREAISLRDEGASTSAAASALDETIDSVVRHPAHRVLAAARGRRRYRGGRHAAAAFQVADAAANANGPMPEVNIGDLGAALQAAMANFTGAQQLGINAAMAPLQANPPANFPTANEAAFPPAAAAQEGVARRSQRKRARGNNKRGTN